MSCTVLDILLENLTQLDAMERQVNHLSVAEIARSLPKIPLHRQGLILLLLQKDKAISVFKQLQVSEQTKLIQEMDLPEAIWLLTALRPIDRHQIFANLPTAMREEFVSTMASEFCRATAALRGIMVRTV
jgi:Mg/Co/Ni transporter MgtE